MVPSPHPILLCTRFSLVNRELMGSWKVSRNSREGRNFQRYVERITRDSARLTNRLQLFRIALANIDVAWQRGHAIRHVCFASDGLLDSVRAELDRLAESYPWLAIRYLGFDDSLDLVSEAQAFYNAHLAQPDTAAPTAMAAARIDDDDILAPAYFDFLSHYLAAGFTDYAVSFSNGFMGWWDDRAQRYAFFVYDRLPMNSKGLARLFAIPADWSTLTTRDVLPPGDHRKVDKQMPVILDGRERLYLYSRHRDADSLLNRRRFNSKRKLRKMYKNKLVGDGSEVDARFDGVPYTAS